MYPKLVLPPPYYRGPHEYEFLRAVLVLHSLSKSIRMVDIEVQSHHVVEAGLKIILTGIPEYLPLSSGSLACAAATLDSCQVQRFNCCGNGTYRYLVNAAKILTHLP